MIRRCVAVVALVALTGCFKGREATVEPSPTASRTVPGTAPVAEQRVTVAHGAVVVQAALIERCEAGSCTRTPNPRFRKNLRAVEGRPVLTITFEREPDEVTGIVRRGRKKVSEQPLTTGVLVAWRPRIPEGLHEARIVATYGEMRIQWAVRIVGAG